MPRFMFFAWPAVVIFAGYLIFCALLANAPLCDLPNHLARAAIVADALFDEGARFGRWFDVQFRLVPYLLGDLLLAALAHAFGIDTAAKLWITTSLLILPAAVWTALRLLGSEARAALVGAVLSLYLAVDWHFMYGFLNYRVAVALMILAVALYWRLLKEWTAGYYGIFCVAVVFGYLMHLSAPVFVAAIVGSSVLLAFVMRRISFLRAALFVAPVLAVLALHFAILNPDGTTHYHSSWGGAAFKIRGLARMFFRFDILSDVPLALFYLGTVLFPLTRNWRFVFTPEAREYLLAALCALTLYFLLPYEAGGAGFIDHRALPLVPLFLLFFGVRAAEPSPPLLKRQYGLALTLAALNLMAFCAAIIPQKIAVGRYREIARRIPAGAYVLPIDTLPRYNDPLHHAGAYATTDRHAVTPYLFAADIYPHMSYFRYRLRPYAPSEFWYKRNEDSSVDWPRVEATYDYLLITLPIDRTRVRLNTTRVAGNEVAELLKITRSSGP